MTTTGSAGSGTDESEALLGLDPVVPGSRRRRVLILGAAGRDFHNFNVTFRDDPRTEVVAFTAAQIPGIAYRHYPPSLSGPLYPEGIPILDEADLEALCREESIDEVVFSYSDVPHVEVMHTASRALASGPDFLLLGPHRTMLQAPIPVIAVTAVRTGCGKSQVSRFLSKHLKAAGLRVAVVRHPMPYGDLEKQAVQRFADRSDIELAGCTLEEREEYEPHVEIGNVVFAGVDYERIVEAASQEADVILWDGGNNDFPFVHPDLLVTLVDPLRAGHETIYHPGETVLRMADVVVVAKVDAAETEDVEKVKAAVRAVQPEVTLVEGYSPVVLEHPERVAGKRVLVVEDGPSLTHGGMSYGAGYVAAMEAGAETIVDPRVGATGTIAQIYERYPHIGPVLPAVGYDLDQIQALRETVEAIGVDVVVSATPIDLEADAALRTPVVRARYEYEESADRGLSTALQSFLSLHGLAG